jgi:hypothetical protein
MIVALKGRDPSLNTGRSHPVGVPQYNGDADPGRCPGLMSVTPSGSIIASKTAGEKLGRSLKLVANDLQAPRRRVLFRTAVAFLAADIPFDLTTRVKADMRVVYHSAIIVLLPWFAAAA